MVYTVHYVASLAIAVMVLETCGGVFLSGHGAWVCCVCAQASAGIGNEWAGDSGEGTYHSECIPSVPVAAELILCWLLLWLQAGHSCCFGECAAWNRSPKGLVAMGEVVGRVFRVFDYGLAEAVGVFSIEQMS